MPRSNLHQCCTVGNVGLSPILRHPLLLADHNDLEAAADLHTLASHVANQHMSAAAEEGPGGKAKQPRCIWMQKFFTIPYTIQAMP